MSREDLGYGFAGSLAEDDAGEDTEGAESVDDISGCSISWLAEGGYHVGGYGEVHCPGVGQLFAFELGEPLAGGDLPAVGGEQELAGKHRRVERLALEGRAPACRAGGGLGASDGAPHARERAERVTMRAGG